MKQNVSCLVYEVVSRIPKGKVVTYGQVSRLVRKLNLDVNLSPRQVGQFLHRNPNPSKIPCHRVVFFDGSLSGNFAFGGKEGQKRMLTLEGVPFRGDRVLIKCCLWKGRELKS